MENTLKALVDQISSSMKLTTTEKEEFEKLAEASEAIVETMAAIEPDDDHKTYNVPLLATLDEQEVHYDGLLTKASKRAKQAHDSYEKQRKDHLG